MLARLIARYIPGVQEAFDMAAEASDRADAADARAIAAEAAMHTESARAAALQAENIALRHVQQEMWERFDAAQARADMAQQTMINVEYQRNHGFAPFPNQPKAPDSIDHAMAAMPAPFLQGRDLARQGAEKFRNDMYAHFGHGGGDDERVSLR